MKQKKQSAKSISNTRRLERQQKEKANKLKMKIRDTSSANTFVIKELNNMQVMIKPDATDQDKAAIAKRYIDQRAASRGYRVKA